MLGKNHYRKNQCRKNQSGKIIPFEKSIDLQFQQSFRCASTRIVVPIREFVVRRHYNNLYGGTTYVTVDNLCHVLLTGSFIEICEYSEVNSFI